ncbi:synaptopodin 2-like protein isoform X2 [Echeneis naucrates]|uniref:synaptopodin 2-like protein isoform X2 n=1 Tax=Echeneis naucrates TaxID=173247 RepID=UPI001113F65D|nr:synaptopodin 2-like protein isoform X2 [Echeneis naucrates]
MVAEDIVVFLTGGAPWGFRLQGGAELQKPLQVAKVRRRSKACRAGLKEHDELIAIDDHLCAELSHAQAMSLIDAQTAELSLRVKRAPSGFHSSSYSGCSASPRSSMRVLSPPGVPSPSHHSSILSPTGIPRCITSPPDSEAYYGETDSDADTQSHTHRRQRRTPPHARSPARYEDQEEEETSEMSGYESATDGGVFSLGQWDGQCPAGVPRRELIYQPLQTDWTTPAHTPHTLTPHTLTPTPDQEVEAEGEGDSGFQEAGGCVVLACAPLVSPERAKEALMSGSSKQLVPMVGPQQTPISDELSTTYMDKARQAKLQRGESVVEKQVKEARTKCRSIASLLTDAPNPNSKGVLMFKKRRQRAKKYTLTCFGKAEGDRGGETEGDTGGETEEEGGSSILSGSEVDEEGFSASFDPTWDSGYLDVLDRRSSACPSTTPTTPTTPTTNHSPGLDISAYQGTGLVTPVKQSPGLEVSGLENSAYQSPGLGTPVKQSPGLEVSGLENSAYQSPGLGTPVKQSPGLEVSGLENSAYQGSRLESSVTKQPIGNHAANMSPPAVALTNGGSVAVSRASVVLSPPTQPPLPGQNGQHGNFNPNPNLNLSASPITDSDHHLNANLSPNAGYLNRTARPFTPGPTPPRASVTSVMFRPPQPKPTAITMETKPVSAVSMVTISPTRHPSGPDARRAVSSTSLYIPPRNNNSNTHPSVNSPPSALSPPSSLSFAQSPSNAHTFSPQSAVHAPPSTPFSPSAQRQLVFPSPVQPFPPPAPLSYPPPPAPTYPPASTCMSSPHPPDVAQVSFHAQPDHPLPPPAVQLSPSLPVHPYMNSPGTVTPSPHGAMTTAPPPQAPAADSLASREQRISVPAVRTGILNDARRRANKKPMFCAVQNKDVSPNPDLLSMVQNMDDHFGKTGAAESGVAPSSEAGHESGPEEDWLRLGAEACNFMQAQRVPRPPPVAPKPQTPQVPQLEGKGGQLFARRQSRMDRYVVERSPSVAAAPYSPAQTREPSPTPSLPATWKYSSNIRAPPPISYNPLLSPSCPPKAQKKPEIKKSGPAGSKGQKAGMKAVDIMSHQPYQLNSTLFSYGGGVPQDTSTYQQQQGVTGGPQKTARVYEVKRFSTPPPTSTGPALKVIVPRSATTLGEPLRRSDVASSPPAVVSAPYQPFHPEPQAHQPQWAAAPPSPSVPPAPNAPLPQLPTFSSARAPNPVQSPSSSHLLPTNTAQANRAFKSAPNLSPLSPTGASQQATSSTHPSRVPRPRFSTSNLGLQPCIWRPGSTMH